MTPAQVKTKIDHAAGTVTIDDGGQHRVHDIAKVTDTVRAALALYGLNLCLIAGQSNAWGILKSDTMLDVRPTNVLACEP